MLVERYMYIKREYISRTKSLKSKQIPHKKYVKNIKLSFCLFMEHT